MSDEDTLPCNNESQDKSKDISNADTLCLMREYFDKRLTSLKREISDEYESKTEKVAKKLKADSVEFKYTGNKRQFEFNLEIDSANSKLLSRGSLSNTRVEF